MCISIISLNREINTNTNTNTAIMSVACPYIMAKKKSPLAITNKSLGIRKQNAVNQLRYISEIASMKAVI